LFDSAKSLDTCDQHIAVKFCLVLSHTHFSTMSPTGEHSGQGKVFARVVGSGIAGFAELIVFHPVVRFSYDDLFLPHARTYTRVTPIIGV
jgi:hypothetical protein